MRGKKAKELRRVAELLAKGAPDRRLIRNPSTGEIRHDDVTVRATYKRLKKGDLHANQ